MFEVYWAITDRNLLWIRDDEAGCLIEPSDLLTCLFNMIKGNMCQPLPMRRAVGYFHNRVEPILFTDMLNRYTDKWLIIQELLHGFLDLD